MSAPIFSWDPQQYHQHASHRARPFLDLLARVPEPPTGATGAVHLADLGCGSGELTALLTDRWPQAQVTGYDSSPQMLAVATSLAGPTVQGGGLDFVLGDVAGWTPQRPHHLILSNAALHWVPDHPSLFPAWVDGLVPGGVLAFQVPGNHTQPSHTLLAALCDTDQWRDCLGHHAWRLAQDPVWEPAGYLEALADLHCEVDAWETTYAHLLTGPDPVLEWVKGTALRPVLAELDGDPTARQEFLDAYRSALASAYPAGLHGTVFPFRRIFVVARKKG